MERLARLMAFAEARGRDKGLRGPSGAWLAVWVLTVSYRYLKKWAAEEPVVVREALLPGQQLVISHFLPGTEPPPEPSSSRRSRRKAKRKQRKGNGRTGNSTATSS